MLGFMEQTMGGLVFRGVGMVRAKANIALTNLVYNMCRLVQIKKYQPNFIATQWTEYQMITSTIKNMINNILSNEKIVVSLHP